MVDQPSLGTLFGGTDRPARFQWRLEGKFLVKKSIFVLGISDFIGIPFLCF